MYNIENKQLTLLKSLTMLSEHPKHIMLKPVPPEIYKKVLKTLSRIEQEKGRRSSLSESVFRMIRAYDDKEPLKAGEEKEAGNG